MTILVMAQVFPPAHGGSGRWLWELYRRLPGIRVVVAAGHAPGAELFDAASPLPIHRIKLAFPTWGLPEPRGAAHYLRALLTLRRIVRQVRPDVIHCGKCLPEGLLAAAFKRWGGLPFSCFVHGEELTLAGTSRELNRLTRSVLRQASTVIANSHHTRQMLVEHWDVVEDEASQAESKSGSPMFGDRFPV